MNQALTHNVGDAFATRDSILNLIDGHGYATVTIDATADGDPQFAMIDNEGDVWIVTVKAGEILASSS